MRVKRIDRYLLHEPTRRASGCGTGSVCIDAIPDYGSRRRIDVIGHENTPGTCCSPARTGVGGCSRDYRNIASRTAGVERAGQAALIVTVRRATERGHVAARGGWGDW